MMVTMTPKQGRKPQLKKKHGVPVIHRGEPLSASTVEKTLEKARRERDERNLSPSPFNFCVI
jgi:hypothetical protein